MKNRIVVRCLVLSGASPLAGAQHAAPLQFPRPTSAPVTDTTRPRVLASRDSALHALNRLAYGPRPGEVDRVAAQGVMHWIDRQLSPDEIDDRLLAQRERDFAILQYDRRELARLFVETQRARRERTREAVPEPAMGQQGRRLAGQFQQLAVMRAALSERQLYEVMVDVWTNHFHVFFGKGADRFLTPDYTERTIRPRALGRFEDLLIATAESPAMLFHLDNWQSIAPGATPPRLLRQRALERMPKGINENYARELLELHTLGVDGGYTQQDVINVARIFTGWSIARPQRGAGFEFHDWAHDDGEKQVLGVRFPAGRGQDEGIIRAKVKTPLEFVVSALRAVRANPDTVPSLAQLVAQLGQPLYLRVTPDGYAEQEDAWVNSGALLDRMNAAVALAAGKLPGVTSDLDAIVPATTDRDHLLASVDREVLGATMSENTRDVIARQIADISDPVAARALAVGLALGGPEFQMQ